MQKRSRAHGAVIAAREDGVRGSRVSTDPATLYRVESARRSLVLATDVEPGNADNDATLRSLASGADVLIHDAQYTPLEHDAHAGSGHST